MKGFRQILEHVVRKEVNLLVDKLMKRFDEEILDREDADDPARPSLCRDEFELFVRKTILDNLKITDTSVEIGVGDDRKLGFSEDLDRDTTDCIKIIGTIIQGITGLYVLVTSEMTGGPEGRFGKAFIMPVEEYRREALLKGWNPNRPIWRFSNFSGIPNFFTKLDLRDLVKLIIGDIGEALKA
jgi:hypothetical protein